MQAEQKQERARRIENTLHIEEVGVARRTNNCMLVPLCKVTVRKCLPVYRGGREKPFAIEDV